MMASGTILGQSKSTTGSPSRASENMGPGSHSKEFDNPMNDDIQKFLNDHLGLVEFRLKPIEKGGSDRIFSRLLQSNGKSFIFMHYGTEVAENAYWTEINRFLNDLNIPVPRIIAYDQRQRFLLLEDLGEIDVYMLRSLPWHKRRPFYLKALSDIHKLHRVLLDDVPAHLQLAQGYDRSLYQW